MDKPEIIIITGPTASGKSALAVELAQRLGTEVVSADSRQIFRHIPIVTAMPTAEERAAVRHHLIDFLEPEEYYSAALFADDARRIIGDVAARTGTAVICGGSMMYLDTLVNGIDELPTVPDDLRRNLAEEHRRHGDDYLRMRLLALDPEYYHRVDLLNMKRVFHAVEISLAASAPYSSLIGKPRPESPFRFRKFLTVWPRELLFGRINRRVDKMVEEGLEQEARSMYPRRHLNSLNTVGLKEMFAYFDGTMDRSTAIAKIGKNTRVYAKKQMTWHKRDPHFIPLDMTASNPIETILENLMRQ